MQAAVAGACRPAPSLEASAADEAGRLAEAFEAAAGERVEVQRVADSVVEVRLVAASAEEVRVARKAEVKVVVAMAEVAMEMVMAPINIQQFQNHRDLEMVLTIEMV